MRTWTGTPTSADPPPEDGGEKENVADVTEAVH